MIGRLEARVGPWQTFAAERSRLAQDAVTAPDPIDLNAGVHHGSRTSRASLPVRRHAAATSASGTRST